MPATAYVAAWEPHSGKSLVTLGLMELLSRRVSRLAYFRPVVAGDPESDYRLRLIRQRYRLATPVESMCGVSKEAAEQMLAEGAEDRLLKLVLDRFRAISRDADFVLCEGTDYYGSGAAFEFDFNARLAVHLGCPAVAVGSARGKSIKETVRSVRSARSAFAEHGDVMAATFVNRARPEQVEELAAALHEHRRDDAPVFVLPEAPTLSRPTLGQVADALGARWLHRPDDASQRDITTTRVAAMTLPNFLTRMADGALVITPGDRIDVIVAAACSRLSEGCPSVAAVMLTGGLEPGAEVQRLLAGLKDAAPPMLSLETDTYTSATAVEAVRPYLAPEDTRRVAAALGVFERNVELDVLADRIAVTRSQRVTPLMFEYDLIERARRTPRVIVLPEGTDDRILRASAVLLERRVAELVILGPTDEVTARSNALGIELSGATLVDPTTDPRRDAYADAFHEMRREKGVTREAAYDAMADANYFGTMMVHTGDAHGMVSGAAHTTAATIRPALQIIRTEPGCSIVSSVFLMCLEDRVLVYGDCAVNPDPNPEQLADIAISSAETAARFGVDPRVAMLSYSTGASGSGVAVDKVRQATELVRERRPDLSIEGPIQYDAAVDASVAKSKMPGSAVAGQATVFVFPDLDSGNNTYKAVQRSAGALAIGPVLQGLRKPVNDLSRGCTVDDIVNTVAITAVQAQGEASSPAAAEPAAALSTSDGACNE